MNKRIWLKIRVKMNEVPKPVPLVLQRMGINGRS
jgi:hypothetical protein